LSAQEGGEGVGGCVVQREAGAVVAARGTWVGMTRAVLHDVQRLGYESIKLTMDTYGQTFPDRDAALVVP
jgi:hypothetical protein